MVNNTLTSYSPSQPTIESNSHSVVEVKKEKKFFQSPIPFISTLDNNQLAFAAAVFLVSVPVFIEAPLVRTLPWLSLFSTFLLVWFSLLLMSRNKTYFWGDLLLGFSWSWLAGSMYWGWLRWEPLYHLPVESIGLPFALWCLHKNWGRLGTFFYLGSLLGTVVTDVYFYLVDLIPFWRQITIVEPEEIAQVLHSALARLQNPWGVSWAVILALCLLLAGVSPLRRKQSHWYAFSGAVLSTLIVDSLFLLAAVVS